MAEDGEYDNKLFEQLKSKYKYLEKFFILKSQKKGGENLEFECQLCPLTKNPSLPANHLFQTSLVMLKDVIQHPPK